MKPSSAFFHARLLQGVVVFGVITLGNLLPVSLAGAEPQPLSNPDASPEAKEVYRYIASIYGKAILAGQQESTWVNRNPDDEMDYIKKVSG